MKWECDITKTCSITLLETLRKAFVKVITNRLSKILAKYHVLKGNNFAGLPGGSTEKPIKIINMLLEDANENKKELWILLQDLSKAYDRVDLKFLRLALQRIKIPVKCVDLIINLFTNRKNAIFTADGLTDYYDIKIGIDQGEVISPLLWCIYLDPLLCEVDTLNKGYEISHTWTNNIISNTTTTLSESISSLAFMDDTNWIANSQQNLEDILVIADDFYDLTRAALNKSKSKLLTTKHLASQTVDINFGSSVVNIKPEQNSVRFLGIWINRSNSQTFVKTQAQKDINNFAAVMKPKPLTDKQIAYIVNAVLCPLLEYRLQCTPLSKRECNIYFSSIRTLFKRKSDFAITIPTVILNSNKYYNLHDLWSLQVKSFSTALLNQFNSKDLYFNVSSIRLFQLQSLNLLPSSPLHLWKHPYNRSSHKNLIGAQLSIIDTIASGFKPIVKDFLSNHIIGGSHSIYQLFSYAIFKQNFSIIKSLQLYYLNQLI